MRRQRERALMIGPPEDSFRDNSLERFPRAPVPFLRSRLVTRANTSLLRGSLVRSRCRTQRIRRQKSPRSDLKERHPL